MFYHMTTNMALSRRTVKCCSRYCDIGQKIVANSGLIHQTKAATKKSSQLRRFSTGLNPTRFQLQKLCRIQCYETTECRGKAASPSHSRSYTLSLSVKNFTTGPTVCWKCGANSKITGLIFCPKCAIIQPPTPGATYFETLGVEQNFDLDTTDLTSKFRNLQQQVHPDRFTQKSKEEQELSDQQSSLINKAYFTLLKPMARGLYMLKINGASLEEDEIEMDVQFLMEIMEVNEELEIQHSLKTVQRIGNRNDKILKKYIGEVSSAFKKNDIQEAKKILAKLKYYANIDEKVKNLELKYTGTL